VNLVLTKLLTKSERDLSATGRVGKNRIRPATPLKLIDVIWQRTVARWFPRSTGRSDREYRSHACLTRVVSAHRVPEILVMLLKEIVGSGGVLAQADEVVER